MSSGVTAPADAYVETAAGPEPSSGSSPVVAAEAATIQFAEALDPEYVCTVCNGPLIDPQRGSCHHEFCRRCIFDRLPMQCPESGCTGTLTTASLLPAPKTVRLMQKLKVLCVHSGRGCPWTGPWGELLPHVEQHCNLAYVLCPFRECGKAFERGLLADHKKGCKYRGEQCKYCLRTLKFCDLALHMEKCEFAPKQCPQGCGVVIQHRQLSQHIESECPNTPVPCPFAEVGCTADAGSPLRRGDAEQHLLTGVQSHLTMVISTLRQERLKHRQEVDALKAELEEHRTKVLSELCVGNAPMSDAIDALSAKVKEQQQVIDRFTTGGTLTVDPSGCGAFSSISEALANCNEGDMILVRAGVHEESFQLSKRQVWIHGAGVGRTIIHPGDNAIRLNGEGVTLTGVTIETQSRVTPAVHVSDGSCTINECQLMAKTSSCCVIAGGTPVFRHCEIQSSDQYGILWKKPKPTARLSSPQTRGLDVLHGSNFSTPISIRSPNPEPSTRSPSPTSGARPGVGGSTPESECSFEHCDIHSNRAGNVVVERGELSLRHCKIHGSSKGNGVWVQSGTTCRLSSCEVFENTFSNVDVVEGGNALLDNCKLHHSRKCGLCVAERGRASIVASEIYANALPNVVLMDTSQTVFKNCKIINGQQHGVVAKGAAKSLLDADCVIEGNSLENFLLSTNASVMYFKRKPSSNSS